MALRLMKLGNTLIKQVTSPPSTRLSTRMERRFSNQASHVPIKDQEKETALVGVVPIWVYGVFAGYLLFLGKIHTEISRELETLRKGRLKRMEEAADDLEKYYVSLRQLCDGLERRRDELRQMWDDQLVTSQGLSDPLYLKPSNTEPERSDNGREN